MPLTCYTAALPVTDLALHHRCSSDMLLLVVITVVAIPFY
jgi:hypothetical protein